MPKEVVTPTPERMRRGVELIDRAIADEDGRPSQPYRSIDILAAMERRGAITPEMRTAGEEFQELFRLAQLDPLRAADHSRPYVDSGIYGSAIGLGIEKARESVWKTILTLGGFESPGASCVWHVLGWGMTLSEWAYEQGWRGKRVSTAAAPMVLITALGVLAKPNS
jgi:hypothetical protein